MVKKNSKISGKSTATVARLLMGEWLMPLKEEGDESLVLFRGGRGYVKSSEFSKKRLLEVYFIDVGQGDCILVQTPDDKRILIDGGPDDKAHSFLKWKYNLTKESNKINFDAIIMTHADKDHANGLIPILKDPQITVDRFYHNGICRFKNKKFPIGSVRGKILNGIFDDVTKIDSKKLAPGYNRLVLAIKNAKKRNPGMIIHHLDHYSEQLKEFNNHGLKVKVLGPLNVGSKKKPKLRFIGGARETINGNSVSIKLEIGKAKLLLCGDMNEAFEDKFLEKYDEKILRAHVFKANHHGSQDFGTGFLDAIKPCISVVSSGDAPDYGHPRAVLLGSLGKYAPKNIERPLLFCTEVAATFKGVSKSQLKQMNSKGKVLYEKTIQGIIHIRTDGKSLIGGRVFGTSKLPKKENPNGYNWDYEKFEL